MAKPLLAQNLKEKRSNRLYFTFLQMLPLLIITSIIFLLSSASPITSGKLVGVEKNGVSRRDGIFPFMVFLEVIEVINKKKKVGFCGGVLVKRDAVLTAAHCLVKCKNNPNIRATVGILDADNDIGQKIYSNGFKIHENFGGVNPDNPKFGHNDIGLVWLHSKFELNENVKLATLPKLPIRMLNNFGTVIGWGLTESQKRSKILKRAELKVISLKTCQQYIAGEIFIGKSFCVKSDNRLDGTCRGDSGGPFIFNGVVRGILSFSGSDFVVDKNGKTKLVCQPEIPQIFTDVSAYYDWILNQLKLRESDAGNMPQNMKDVCLNSPMIYRETVSS